MPHLSPQLSGGEKAQLRKHKKNGRMGSDFHNNTRSSLGGSDTDSYLVRTMFELTLPRNSHGSDNGLFGGLEIPNGFEYMVCRVLQ